MAKRNWTDEQLIEAVRNSKSVRDVLKQLGTTSYLSVKRRIEFLDLDTSHFKVRKPSGIKKDGRPNVYWRRFKERLDAYEQVPIEEWKAEHILGHILRLYKERYGLDFNLSYSRPPSKCAEIYCINRMLSSLGTEDGHIAKQYVEWVFDDFLKKNSLSSLALFFNKGMILKFKAKYKKANKITRSTQLPSKYSDIVEELKLPIYTYGDLAFAKMAVDENPEDYPDCAILLKKLQDSGFDNSLLENLEG